MTTSHEAPKREAIIDRIRKLSRMTLANGASEAEALKAAQVLRDLMDTYQVNQDELTLKRDSKGCVIDAFRAVGKRDNKGSRPVWQAFGDAISRLFECKTYTSRDWEDLLGLGLQSEVQLRHFYGFPEDVAAAIALMTITYNAMIADSERQKKREQFSFELGFSDRIVARLQEMIDRRKVTKTTGTALIVLKDQLVTDEWARYMQEHNLRFVTPRQAGTPVNREAYARGVASGSRVDLGGAKLSKAPLALTRG